MNHAGQEYNGIQIFIRRPGEVGTGSANICGCQQKRSDCRTFFTATTDAARPFSEHCYDKR
jgi:hypothetical protein